MTRKGNINCDANGLLDKLLVNLALKNDAALSRHLGVAPPVISKLRTGRMPVGDSFIVRCLEQGSMSIREVRAYVPTGVQP